MRRWTRLVLKIIPATGGHNRDRRLNLSYFLKDWKIQERSVMEPESLSSKDFKHQSQIVLEVWVWRERIRPGNYKGQRFLRTTSIARMYCLSENEFKLKDWMWHLFCFGAVFISIGSRLMSPLPPSPVLSPLQTSLRNQGLPLLLDWDHPCTPNATHCVYHNSMKSVCCPC